MNNFFKLEFARIHKRRYIFIKQYYQISFFGFVRSCFNPAVYVAVNTKIKLRKAYVSCQWRHFSIVVFCTYGLQPKSWPFIYKIPALDTVAGVAECKFEISNSNHIFEVKEIRSLLARVNTYFILKNIKTYKINIANVFE